MKFRFTNFLLLLGLLIPASVCSQKEIETEKQIVDVVYLKDGSKLSGKILKWELARGMEFQLATGAVISIPKEDIKNVMQDTPFYSAHIQPRERGPKAYSFRETGWYQNSSGFINPSFSGGAGIHHVMGYRFNRKIGVGFGMGIETHDFNAVRNIIPVFAEVRGFLLPKKVTPYYALKLGYGFALKDEISGTLEGKGGIHISPELGVRFGAGDVNFYAGLEYKLQNATFIWNGWDFWGNTRLTDKVSYRRIEFRTGLLF